MKRSRTLIKTLLVLGPMALALSACASNSSYADASIGSACPPYSYDSSCAYAYPYGFYDDGGDWWRHDDWRRGNYRGYDHGVDHGFGHAGFGHGGFGHGGGGHGGGGHGR